MEAATLPGRQAKPTCSVGHQAARTAPHLWALGLCQPRQARGQQAPAHALSIVLAVRLHQRQVQLGGGLREWGTGRHTQDGEASCGGSYSRPPLTQCRRCLFFLTTSSRPSARLQQPGPTCVPHCLPAAARRSRRSTCAVSRLLPPTSCHTNWAASTPCSASTVGALMKARQACCACPGTAASAGGMGRTCRRGRQGCEQAGSVGSRLAVPRICTQQALRQMQLLPSVQHKKPPWQRPPGSPAPPPRAPCCQSP